MVGADTIEQRLQIGDGLRGVGLDPLRLQPPPDFGFIEIAEQDPSQGGMQGRQPAADRQRCRHDAAGRHACDIDAVIALQDRGRAGFAEAFAQLAHQGQRAIDPALRREVGEAEIEDLRRQREHPAILLDIAELGEGAQHASRGGPREVRDPCRLRQGHRRPLPAERAKHREALGQRRHEFLVLGIAFTLLRRLRHEAAC